MGGAYKNLRHGAPTGEFGHCLARASNLVHADFVEFGDAALFEQLFGLVAVGTGACGVDLDGLHGGENFFLKVLKGDGLNHRAYKAFSITSGINSGGFIKRQAGFFPGFESARQCLRLGVAQFLCNRNRTPGMAAIAANKNQRQCLVFYY